MKKWSLLCFCVPNVKNLALFCCRISSVLPWAFMKEEDRRF